MAHIQHIAIRTEDPEKLARYYEDVFGWTRLRSTPAGSVHMSDGHINVAILNTNGAPAGVNHFGVKIDSLDEVREGLARHDQTLKKSPADRAVEMRITDPDGNEIDLSVSGWLSQG
jgi:catechol 2,3-dioxygenase-like lactoylglutathione lyase family enzyme